MMKLHTVQISMAIQKSRNYVQQC